MGKGVSIVLDNIVFFLQRSGGGSVYWSEIIKRLDKASHDITYLEPQGEHVNIFYKSLRQKLAGRFVTESMKARPLSFVPSGYRSPIPFIFHSSYYRTAANRQAINIVTIHDFMPEMFFSGVKRFYHSWRKRRAIRKADGIVCISSNTKTDLLSYYPEAAAKHLVTIPLGIANDYYVLSGDREVPGDGNEKRYILYVGRRSHYKNFAFALSILERLVDFKLVVAGEEWSTAELSLLAGCKDRVELILNPSNEQMNVLYNKAFCLLYPSSYEGFGIPIVEAMAAGCPVVALNASSIPEVSGGAALLLERLDPNLFADAIRSIEDQSLRWSIVQKGLVNAARYSWDHSVHELLNFYMSVYDERSK